MSYITLDEFEYWLKRSDKAFAAAEQLTDPCAKEQMAGTAKSYLQRARCDWGDGRSRLNSGENRLLTASGFRAVALGANGGSGELIEKFDPKVEQTLFIPQLKGG